MKIYPLLLIIKLLLLLISTSSLRQYDLNKLESTTTLTSALEVCPPEDIADFTLILPKLQDSDIAIGYLLSVCTFVVFIPQFYLILKNKSTHGVSITTIFISALSNVLYFWSALVLNYNVLLSCSIVNTKYCIPYIQPFVQSTLGLVMAVPLYITMLVVYSLYDSNSERVSPEASREHIGGLSLLIFGELITFLSVGITVSIISATLLHYLGQCDTNFIRYAQGLAIFCSVLTIFQWWPQILVTYTLKEAGNLSIITLIAFVVLDVLSIYYSIRLQQDWSLWTPNVVDFILVTSLLLMIFYFHVTNTEPAEEHKSINCEEDRLLVK